MGEQKEGFEVLAELTNRHWRNLERHADTSANVGPFAMLPAVTLPQAQLDMAHAIREAFHAGAALQASLPPLKWSITLDEHHWANGDNMARTASMVAEPDRPIDLGAIAAALPKRIPNEYVQLFTDTDLQLFCPTCHQYTPLPQPEAAAVVTS